MSGRLDDEAFSDFVTATWPRLYRTAYLLLGDRALAEDLVQTSLAKVYANWHRVREPAAAPGYARTTMVNTATAWFRKQSWRAEHPTGTPQDRQAPDDEPEVRLTVMPGVAVATLSPDGRYAQAGEFGIDSFFGSFYDLGTGTERRFDTFTMTEGPEPACSHSCGWTSTHRVLSVLEDGTVSSCSPRRLQRCDSWRIELPHGAVPSDVVYAAEVTHPRA